MLCNAFADVEAVKGVEVILSCHLGLIALIVVFDNVSHPPEEAQV